MATRCNIAIVLKPEDLGRPLNFMSYITEHDIDLAMLECSSARSLKNDDLEDIFTDVKTTSDRPVLQIYSHWDGYPEGVGQELLDNFNSYEQALALVLAGDTSGVYDGATHVYSLGKGEEYRDCKPVALQESCCHEEYLYTFADGEWKLGEKRFSLAEYLKDGRAFRPVDASVENL